MERDYPHLPFGWLEMCYDFVENTDSESVNEIINSKKWETPGKFTNDNKKDNDNDTEKEDNDTVNDNDNDNDNNNVNDNVNDNVLVFGEN